MNADAVIAGINSDVKGYNMFAYCFNNPVNMTDSFGNWPSWGQVLTVAAIVASATLAVIAIATTAGTAAIALGATASVYLGASATTASIVTTVATVGSYAVAAGIGACALSNAGEVLTGTNVIRDYALGGNYVAYDTIQTGLNFAGMALLDYASNVPVSVESKSSSQKESAGKPFEYGKRPGTSQFGVDPNTLTPNGRTILDSKMQNCINKCNENGGIYGTIDVYSNGVIYDGHHRVEYAKTIGAAVDVFIVQGGR